MSGMPGPSSTTLTSIRESVSEASSRPPDRVDDHVHLRLVGGDHGAPDGLGVGPDALEVLLDGARGRARPAEVVALDVVGDELHQGFAASLAGAALGAGAGLGPASSW